MKQLFGGNDEGMKSNTKQGCLDNSEHGESAKRDLTPQSKALRQPHRNRVTLVVIDEFFTSLFYISATIFLHHLKKCIAIFFCG